VRRAVLVALLLAAAVVAACGGQLSSSGDDDRVRIAYVPKSLNQEYWVNTKKGAEAGVRGQDAEVITQSANADTEIAEQIDIVENLLAQDVDALAIAPSSSDLLKPVLERAAKDIPVVLVDSDIADWKPKTAYVGTENFDGAKLAGKYIAEQMKDGGRWR
jgi:ribose transport system substrate-binding protein